MSIYVLNTEILCNGGEKVGNVFRWRFDGKVLEAYNVEKISRAQRVYEVHVIDLVIDEETGDIIEIHIQPDKYEAPQLIKYLREKGFLEAL